MPKQLAEYRDICVEAKDAFRAHDADALSASITKLDNIPTELIDCDQPEGSELTDSDFHFTADWLDTKLCEWLNSGYVPHYQRRGGDISTKHVKVKGNAPTSITFEGCSLISVVVIAEDDTNIQIGIQHPSCKHEYESAQPAQNGCQAHSWTANDGRYTPITLTITNPTDHDIVCLIVSN